MQIHELVQNRSGLKAQSVIQTIALFDEGCTIPFIARYRKERTGSLDENQISSIKESYDKVKELIKRKEYILKTIDEQGNLTDALKQKIATTWDERTLEDLYLPFKRKSTTKAAVAIANGLEPLAKIIMSQNTNNLHGQAQRFAKGKVKSAEDALAGARHIIAAWINENTQVRERIRQVYDRHAIISSKVIAKKKDEAVKYRDYFDFEQSLSRCPSHRLLAIYRGENEDYLRVKISIDNKRTLESLERKYIRSRGVCAEQIELSIADSVKRLIYPSLENEVRKASKLRADTEAIKVFSENLKQLLLASPLGQKSVLAIDPGFRTGCKVVALDAEGDLVSDGVIYPHPPQAKVAEAQKKIQQWVATHNIEAIAIGNGTAGRETMNLCKAIDFGKEVDIYLVNESGASIYSASKVAQEEFPNKDITVRGAVSIGRRLMDPLAELVKIDAKSIGVGQYQHDVDQSLLKSSLDQTVINSVNAVGINLNTASKHLLTYVSGLGPALAQNIVNYRSEQGAFTQRSQLKKVTRMGAKAYEQAAGFLRIRDAKNPLDNTAVHPEQYDLVKKMAQDQSMKVAELIADKEAIQKIKLSNYVSDRVGMPTLKDIQQELLKPGLDIRGEAEVTHFTDGVQSIDDIRAGMVLSGVVNNLTKFGAFVDIGIKESGLIHISQIVDRYISDPAEVLSLTQAVKVKVLDVDKARKRISLSMKDV